MIKEISVSCSHNADLANLHNLYVFNVIWGKENAKFLFVADTHMEATQFHLSVFNRKPLEMGCFFIYCTYLKFLIN